MECIDGAACTLAGKVERRHRRVRSAVRVLSATVAIHPRAASFMDEDAQAVTDATAHRMAGRIAAAIGSSSTVRQPSPLTSPAHDPRDGLGALSRGHYGLLEPTR